MKKTLLCGCVAAASLLSLALPAEAKQSDFRYEADWDQIRSHYECPEWFRDAKLGIFIHWGPYCVPAHLKLKYNKFMYYTSKPEFFDYHREKYGDQKEFGYKDFIPMFTAEKFDPHQWVKLFKDAGAKYVVPVAEHHDSFAMYDSKYTEWNSVNMGPKRDVLGDIMGECRKQGLKCGASSHLANWVSFFPKNEKFDTGDPANEGIYWKREASKEHVSQEFLDLWWNRTTDIIDTYKPDILWFDFCSDKPSFKPYYEKMLAHYYNMGLEQGKEVVFQNKNMGQASYPEDLIILDLERGLMKEINKNPWQIDTSVSSISWSYIEDDDYKTSNSLIDDLMDIISKNGNMLLNVGPKSDGTIPDESIAVLTEMGEWLKINGEGVYDTRPWKIYGEGPTEVAEGHYSEGNNTDKVAADIRFTAKDDALYATSLAWARGGDFLIKSLSKGSNIESREIKKIKFISGKNKFSWEQTASGLKINVEGEQPCQAAYMFKITFK